MAIKKTKLNSKVTRGVKQNSAGPTSNPMSGIFDWGSYSGVTPASQPWELFNNTSYNLLSLQRVMLSYAYVIHGPIRTLVDQPVYDAFRGGLRIKSDEVSPEELEEFNRELRKLKLVKRLTEALRWDRLFGGSGIIINMNENYSSQLKIENLKEVKKLELIVADRWELAWSGTPNAENAYFNYYGHKIHQSRVARIVGEEPPSLVKQRLQGWGMSVIECVIREISSYFKNNNVIFELLDEAKIDVWKIKGFNAQVLSQLAAGKTSARIKIATQMKNFLNAITLDSEDDYEQKQVTFTGLAEMLEQVRIGIAAAVRMPMAKIFGLASKGFASGEDDIENYNAIVEAQRDRAEDVLDLIIPVIAVKVWGFVPDDLKYEWKPLRVLSAEQVENVKTQKFSRAMQMVQQGLLSPQEFMQYLKEEDILTMETAVSKGAEPEPLMGSGQEDIEMEGESEDSAKPSDGKKPTKAKE